VLGDGTYPTFQSYLLQKHIRSFVYGGPVEVGTVLPPAGIEYYPVPPQFAAPAGYNYTVINGQPVIVDPYHRIVQVAP
jgi:hypothetical protein